MTLADKDLPKDKGDLLDRIQQAWAALLALVATLDETQMLQPDAGGWSIKDNLAHLTEWERFLINNQFEGQAAPVALNIEPATLKNLDEAGINAVLLERNQARPLHEVLADLHQTHARLLAALDRVTFSDLQQPTRSLGPNMEPALMWVIYNTYDHYAEHRQTITRYVGQ
jgi:uncharacterized protein (TIGR03083 family)